MNPLGHEASRLKELPDATVQFWVNWLNETGQKPKKGLVDFIYEMRLRIGDAAKDMVLPDPDGVFDTNS